MKKIIFIIMVGLMTQVYAQNIHLSKSHNPSTGKSTDYIVDCLRLDSAMYFSIGLERVDIKRVRANVPEPVIFVTTNLVIILNDELLSTSKEKKKLSTINLADIESIQKIKKEQSVALYGKRGKNGVLVVKYKQ